MDSDNVHSTSQIRKDIEDKLNHQILCITQSGVEDIDEIVRNLDVQRLEDEVLGKYNQHVEPTISLKVPTENEDLWTTLNSVDYDNYDKLSQSLSNKKTVATQVRALDKLLLAYVIDTKQKAWLPLSRNLQQCLTSPNAEIFQKSLQIHHKLLSTPTVCSEGYLNLIHALILMFNDGEFFKNTQEVNENHKFHRRALSVLKLLLKSQNVLLKNWLHVKHKVIEEVLITFIYMLNYSTGSERELGALDFLSVLDSDAKWFKKFCYGLQTRTILFGCLRRTPNLIKYFMGTFLDYMDSNSQNHRQFLNFSHASHFLQHFLMYNYNFSVFPVRIKASQEILNFESFILTIVMKINSWNESPRRKVLTDFLKFLLTTHERLILNHEIQRKLFEQLSTKGVNRKQLYSTVEKNGHVLAVMNELAKSTILPSLLSLRKSDRKYNKQSWSSREKINNPLQVIMNITIACMRNYINQSESQHYVNNVIFELIDCCQNLFDSHKRSFVVINFNKLVISLRDFYKTLTNYDDYNSHYKSRIAISLCFFIENDYLTLNTVESESGFLHEIVCHALVGASSIQDCGRVILAITGCKEGLNTITFNHDILIKQNLKKIWAGEGNEDSSDFNLETNKLLNFIHIVSYNFKAVEALLIYENEGTIVGNQERPLALTEIIENCLDVSSLCTAETVLGLKIIKMLITNIDILVYLQSNYKLQENLIELQVNSRVPCSNEQDDENGFENDSTAMIIDECSCLRHNILLSIKYVGRIDTILNEKMLDQAQIIVAPPQSSNNIKMQQRSPNELQKFLHSSKSSLHDRNWILQARRAYKTISKERYKVTTIAELMEQVAKTTLNLDFVWPTTGTVLLGLFPEEYHTATLVVRFGIQNGLLLSSAQNEENLIMLFRQSRTFLNYRPEEFIGSDWFVAIIFLVCHGNMDRSKSALINVAGTSAAPIIWPALGAALNIKQSVCDRFYRQLEIIVEDTTRIGCALQMLGVSVRHIAKKWLDHCFFTMLDFNEICNFLMLAILYPTEYVSFFIIAVLEHIKNDIFTAAYSHDFKSILKITKIPDFQVNEWFQFMDKLNRQYRNSLQH